PKGETERIFERFYRVDKSRSKDSGGTGLGLSIVKHGAKYHNAQVYVSSEEGKGSTFSIVFNI
ncbi:MAG: ATP-binding protein, partial [Treponema sp.]|nr:ATP-binding protein [Treponema sp.]